MCKNNSSEDLDGLWDCFGGRTQCLCSFRKGELDLDGMVDKRFWIIDSELQYLK